MKTKLTIQKFLSTENVVAFVLFVVAFLMPLFMNAYRINTFSYFYTSILLGLSLSLIWGFCGIFSFGQAAFFGIGAYTYGLVGKAIGSLALTPLVALLAIIVAGLVAGILGYFMFYGGINDVFVGLITLCFTLALSTFLGQTAGPEWKIFGQPLGGYNGLNGISSMAIGNHKLDKYEFYILTLCILLMVYLALRFCQKSKSGYALLSIRENRTRSELFGYNVAKIQVFVFAIGGMIAGLAGVLYVCWGNYVTPSNMDISAATIPVVLVAAGGRKNPTAAALFIFIYSYLSQSLSSGGSQFALIILGLILILVILFVPSGIFAWLFEKVDYISKNYFMKSKE